MHTKWMPTLIFLLLLPLAGCQSSEETETAAAEPPIQENARIVFFGDSITEQGEKSGGYVQLVRDSLHEAYPNRNIEVIGAGISGNRVPDLLNRVEEDVLSKDPTTTVIYIGINDVWHWELNDGGTPKDEYRAGLRTLVDTLQQAGSRVLVCTPSVIGEKTGGQNKQDAMLEEYASISRKVARAQGAQVCDLRAAFKEYLNTHNSQNEEQGVLTVDGVHLNERGNQFVAREMVEALTRRTERVSPQATNQTTGENNGGRHGKL